MVLNVFMFKKKNYIKNLFQLVDSNNCANSIIMLILNSRQPFLAKIIIA